MAAPAPAIRPDFRVLQDTLTEVLTQVPYNSAAQYHVHYGTGSSPERFGTACAWQTFRAGERIALHTGTEAEYRVGGRHVCALYDDGETLTVIDPYLMHRTPLLLARADAVDGVVRAEAQAYPLRHRPDGSPAPSLLRALWQPADGVLRLQYLRYSPRLGDRVMHRAYTMRPGDTVRELPVPAPLVRELLLHPEQDNLSVRAVHPGDDGLAEVVLPFAGRPRGALADAGALIARDNQGAVSRWGSAAFAHELERVAQALRCDPDEVVDHLLGAAALYDAAAPAGLLVNDYSLEDA
ncbi:MULTISPECIES: hypothetical protein [unclassified Streptomyces]|uniref:hypothetical protein n=1 Tax=unclassified Streptomyces TaxID=2593676 RepID=UPI0020309A6E|nr:MULTISPECIES: hypothetical protein [unclassified Streptomyces]MCM1969363.1 hypothetical protein [Streptomyces sp. G1]MCX5127246.1 hypothetical protein [Streptomyces sp. NBC_00347]